MEKTLNDDRCLPARADQAWIDTGPDHLPDLEARLVQGLQRALTDGRIGPATVGPIALQELARRLVSRSEVLEPKYAQVAAWMKRVDRRLSQIESRLADLMNRAADQQQSIRMICAILTDLDDPYGFGLSLDERLVRDESGRTSEEEG